MTKVMVLMIIGMLTSTNCMSQENGYLKTLKGEIVQLRNEKVSNDALNKTLIKWSKSDRPKITLMDEIKRDENNEYRGADVKKFKMNQLVTYVYNRQNIGMVSKGDYFNSTEKGIYYSAIEKTVKKGNIVTYRLTGHVGKQEFVFIAFNPKTRFTAKVNGKQAEGKVGANDVCWVTIPQVHKEDVIVISIANNSPTNESFVILNHNPQK